MLYPQSTVTSSLCYRGGRLHAAAQPRCVDTLGVRIRGRRIGTILYPSTAATNKSVSEFRGNIIEVTKVCERGERGGAGVAARAGGVRCCYGTRSPMQEHTPRINTILKIPYLWRMDPLDIGGSMGTVPRRESVPNESMCLRKLF